MKTIFELNDRVRIIQRGPYFDTVGVIIAGPFPNTYVGMKDPGDYYHVQTINGTIYEFPVTSLELADDEKLKNTTQSLDEKIYEYLSSSVSLQVESNREGFEVSLFLYNPKTSKSNLISHTYGYFPNKD